MAARILRYEISVYILNGCRLAGRGAHKIHIHTLHNPRTHNGVVMVIRIDAALSGGLFCSVHIYSILSIYVVRSLGV